MTDRALIAERSSAAPRPKGPPVWRDMDQQELDAAYDQSKYAPNQAQIQERRLVNSARARALLGEPLRLAYGASAIEQLDVYRTDRANAPVNVFIHGGAWRNGRSADFAYLAELFVHAGAHSVVLDFINIDEVGGNLMTMAKQVRSAVAFIHKNAASFRSHCLSSRTRTSSTTSAPTSRAAPSRFIRPSGRSLSALASPRASASPAIATGRCGSSSPNAWWRWSCSVWA